MGTSSVNVSVLAGAMLGSIDTIAVNSCIGAGAVTVLLGVNAVMKCGDSRVVGAQLVTPFEPMVYIWTPSATTESTLNVTEPSLWLSLINPKPNLGLTSPASLEPRRLSRGSRANKVDASQLISSCRL